MKCPDCGKEIPVDNPPYCPFCGVALDNWEQNITHTASKPHKAKRKRKRHKKKESESIVPILIACMIGLIVAGGGYAAYALISNSLPTPSPEINPTDEETEVVEDLGEPVYGLYPLKDEGAGATYIIVDSLATDEDVENALRIISERLQRYTTTANVYRTENAITIEIPISDNADLILDAVSASDQVYLIARTDASGEENFSLGAYIDDDGQTMYGYYLEKSIPELMASGSVYITSNDIILAEQITQTGFDGGDEYIVQIAVADDAIDRVDEICERLFKENELTGVYFNDDFVSVEPAEIPSGNGTLIIRGFADMASAEAFARSINIGPLPFDLSKQ